MRYRDKNVQNQTKSLWSFANHNRDLFLNPFYRGDVRRTQISGKMCYCFQNGVETFNI